MVTLNIKFCSKNYFSWLFLTPDKRVLPALRASVSRFLRRGIASFLSVVYIECATHRALICTEYKIHLTHSHAFRHVVGRGRNRRKESPTVFLITFPASALFVSLQSSERIAATFAFFMSPSISCRPMGRAYTCHFRQKLGPDDDRKKQWE